MKGWGKGKGSDNQIACTLHMHSGAITTMRVLMSMPRENLSANQMASSKNTTKFLFRQLAQLCVTNIMFRKFDLPRYALCDKLNKMVQYL